MRDGPCEPPRACPTVSRSTTSTSRRPRNAYAVASPSNPAPTITTSAALDLRHAPTLRRTREDQPMRLELVTLVVRDYEEGLDLVRTTPVVLGFVLVRG